jgi:hypothetical protein
VVDKGAGDGEALLLAHAAITTLREKLETMGFTGLDTLGLLKNGFAAKNGCGVSPQTVLEASRHQSSSS